ncbi:MAG: dockerin type I repeat-containing protein [Sodaliphilus sp.]
MKKLSRHILGYEWVRMWCIGMLLWWLTPSLGLHASVVNVWGRYAYQVNGENLFVAYNNGAGVEYTYWFKKCMANELYTFYRVGYRTVDRQYSSAEAIDSDAKIIYFNKTSSDNIGPVSMLYGGFVGGNHLVVNPVDGQQILSARNDAFAILIDGKQVEENAEGMASTVKVEVENTVFDPGIPPQCADVQSLLEPLYKEYVSYSICKNSIEVAVRLSFVETTTNGVFHYYGMQSMFDSETHFMTPNGKYTTWQEVENTTFSKGDYPNFNRYIEKNDTRHTYQSAYLYPNVGIGNHSQIGASSFIFNRSSNKLYHHQMEKVVNVAGKEYEWAGTYTFFTEPWYETDSVFAYRGSISGKEAMFVNTKCAFSGIIPLPPTYKHFSVVENFGVVDEHGESKFQVGENGVWIQSDSAGSLILQPEMQRGDVNGDGTVDVDDVTMLINIILGNEHLPDNSCDLNADGDVNVSDVSEVVNLILQ